MKAATAVSATDYEVLACHALDDAAWSYFAGGAGDELTLRANRAAWDAIALMPRVLRELAGGHTRVELLGRTWPTPLLVAPVAHQKLAHPDGERASAMAAAAQGTGFVLSTQTSVPMEHVAAAVRDDAQRGPLWFQLYWQRDRGLTSELVQRAEAAGFEALVLTVDAPVQGPRDRERRAGFRVPAHAAAVHLHGPSPRPLRPLGDGDSALFDDLLLDAPAWRDVEWLRGQTRLPLVLKGVLHPDDARDAQRAGAAAVVVSNHGGRTLDTAPATADALPAMADAVGDALPLLVDGGIRRGTDVLKAIALGARAVLVGRPAVFALAAGGAPAVAHLLRLLRDELEIAMALTGCRTLGDAGPALLAPRR
ncbi:alpha-hydroxy-acid oxidizing protein [Calidifontimicrobium sp. SYSU G02091]|uniref:alpha-hydroxy acid oxidase n=1 Tax=Calidifontimicrobium sp. SYSU G02091 TaxID=2926421 RepID=UPI001F53BAED|nr:alpha-hydroxy acid oxidase [Calidifontimicrobium sp. SYSU G02091]MCI1190353.1 alpha-hydroxy-acid oxidizing protein [Calidifontimicrobium sp. SYSU G02091]